MISWKKEGKERRGIKIRYSLVLTIVLHLVELCIASADLLLGEVHSRSGIDALGCLSHYLDAITGTAEQCHVACIPRVTELLDNFQESLFVLRITINQTGLLCLGGNNRRRCDSLQGLLHKGGFSSFGLTLLASGGRIGRGRGSTGIAFGCGSWVTVHPLHMVP